MAKKAKLLWSSPWGKRSVGGWWRERGSYLSLCGTRLDQFYDIPKEASEIRIHLYDRPAKRNCVRFRLEIWYGWGDTPRCSWTSHRTEEPAGAFTSAGGAAVAAAPLGWKDDKATVWAEIEYK